MNTEDRLATEIVRMQEAIDRLERHVDLQAEVRGEVEQDCHESHEAAQRLTEALRDVVERLGRIDIVEWDSNRRDYDASRTDDLLTLQSQIEQAAAVAVNAIGEWGEE